MNAGDERYWNRDTVRAALIEAGRTLRALRMRGLWPGEIRSAMPDPVRSWWEAYSTEAAPLRAAQPGPGQIGRLDQVMGWIAGRGTVAARRTLWALALGLPVVVEARARQCSRQTVHQHRRRELLALVADLNQPPLVAAPPRLPSGPERRAVERLGAAAYLERALQSGRCRRI